MNTLDIKVKNLGKLKNGTIKIRPLTVLVGENGTGKSFFTKTLYSIFSVLNNNVLHKDITSDIRMIEHLLIRFSSTINRFGQNDKNNIDKILKYLQFLATSLNKSKKDDITFYIDKVANIKDELNEKLEAFNQYLQIIKQQPTKYQPVVNIVFKLENVIKSIRSKFNDSNNQYAYSLEFNFANEIKENFQVSNLSDIVSFKKDKCSLSADLFKIGFDKKNTINFFLDHKFINQISSLSRVVFFESPAYWKVRDALNDARNIPVASDLTGVPKYFYDLDKALRTKSKESNNEILDLSGDLKEKIGGEFVFDSGGLYFQDINNNAVDKNLVSFGMTNLGMVQALLKHNVISKGSFVFFDEPETNLHPQWQVLLADIFIKLADNDINVVMATHSLDMIKMLEVKTKNKDSNFIAINHFKDAKVNPNAAISEVLDDLASPFYDLYMKNL